MAPHFDPMCSGGISKLQKDDIDMVDVVIMPEENVPRHVRPAVGCMACQLFS